ncbi:cystathionine gamma-synthase [Spirochaetia bacterium]|nr:cystathionine gamma-synthase [Spirochaetia bacterium]
MRKKQEKSNVYIRSLVKLLIIDFITPVSYNNYMKFGTKLLLNGHDPQTGALSTPIYQCSTYAWKDINGKQEFDYSRSGNPTRKALEDEIALLENGVAGFAFASGMAATSSVLGILQSGDHIITAQDIYGGSYRIMNTFYKRWGLLCTAVDTQDIANIKAALRPNTKALFLETPSNPLLKITDLSTAVNFARENNLISVVDNTFMTPYLQRPLELGADIVIHSATKFLGGHSDVILGLAVTRTDELAKRIYPVQNGFGAVPGPQDIWLTLRGIKTLKVRMDASQKTAGILARWFSEQKNIEAVYYPGLSGHEGKVIHDKQADGAGAVLSFKTKTEEQAHHFLNNLRYAKSAVSLGAVETIASYPVKMSHAGMPPPERQRLGITPTLIRLSAGLEDPQDLIEEFEAALR